MGTLPAILSLVRFILTMAGGFLVTKGYVDNDVVTSLGGTLPSVISLVWSMLTHAPVKASEVAQTVSQVADTVSIATKDDQTKEVLKNVRDLLNQMDFDKAKGELG